MTSSAQDTLWIFRLDGTIQCTDVAEVSLELMRADLEKRIGAEKVLQMEKRSIVMIALCGMPTGRANAYLVTQQGWYELQNGIVGNPGFTPWPEGNLRAMTETNGGGSKTVDDLIGLHLRAYTSDQGITYDFRTDRVNIESSPGGKIVRVWFG